MSVVGVLLAAGAGSRFGGEAPKPLAEFRGAPLVTWPLAALRAGGVDQVVVVLGAAGDEVVDAVDFGDATIVPCAGWAEGLSASLRTGVAVAAQEHGAAAVVIALGDQPLLGGDAVARVIGARAPGDADVLRATYDGVPGHPTVLEASTFPAVAALRGDTGARDLDGARTRLVACDGLGSPADVDTPEDLARLEAGG